ncbi:MAG: 3-dehydroquinate dehydratase [Gammaproteobacteria bacterium]|nr:3-dehydroquinate dehydratase [Gammaproteobacteria bacterium]
MKIHIINGPNLNLLGKREEAIYGNISFDDYLLDLKKKYSNVEFVYYQSNIEGGLINYLQEHGFDGNSVVLNAGGYTHTSIALSDTIAAISNNVIEVHISNIYSREKYRQHSLLSKNCVAVIAGLGLPGYDVAIDYFLRNK